MGIIAVLTDLKGNTQTLYVRCCADQTRSGYCRHHPPPSGLVRMYPPDEWPFPLKGRLAVCSKGSLGLITNNEPQAVRYPDGCEDIAYVGVHLTDKIAPMGSPWSSRMPRIVAHLHELRSDRLTFMLIPENGYGRSIFFPGEDR